MARTFYLSAKDKKLGGVCGGLAEYFDVDPTLVRVAWIVGTIVSVGVGLLAYVLLWALAPQAPRTEPSPPLVLEAR